jgi:hypothetical protein
MQAGICLSTSRAVAIAFAAVVNLVSASASGATLWVGNLGVDNASCRSQQSPCRSISQAIENAADGDTIKVGPGHYGNVSGNSNYGGLGDERPQIVSDGGCVVCISKALRIYSVGGAAVTIIEGIPGTAYTTNVQILHDGVVLGAPGMGFTLTGGNTIGLLIDQNDPDNGGSPGLLLQRNITVAGNVDLGDQNGFAFNGLSFTDRPCPVPQCAAIAQILFADNEASGNAGAGFKVTVGEFFGGPITLQGNLARGAGTGFAATAGCREEACLEGSAGIVTMTGNVAIHNGVGFVANGAGMTANTATGNSQAGFLVIPAGGPFTKNSAIGNAGPGAIVQFSTGPFDSQPGVFQPFSGNNFYGNDRNRPMLSLTIGSFGGANGGPPGYDPGTSAHCGVLNVGALAFFWLQQGNTPAPMKLPAAGNFWGSATGFTSTGAGDAVGGACDQNAGTTVAKPFATAAFATTSWPPATVEVLPNVQVLYCSRGVNKYTVGPPNNDVSSNVSPNPHGSPSLCAVPSSEPATWYIKTTTDSGATWQWIDSLGALGLGSPSPY